MSGELSPAMETEFDQLAGWTEETLVGLSPEDAVAAACRGSGNPAALTWLAEAMQIGNTTTVLDVGGGLGGPAAWLQHHYGAQLVVAEPMPRAALGAHRLWKIPSVVAWAEHLPFPAGSFAAAWALGVLDTTSRKAELLAELHRVVQSAGRVGLLAYERTVDTIDTLAAPEGNHFPSADEMAVLLDATGWAIVSHVNASTLSPPPLAWQERAADAGDRVADEHDDDEAMTDVRSQERQMRSLLDQRIVVARLYHTIRL
jgi:SAM-dependent methyltransferase